MKKLMIAAAFAAMIGSVFAAVPTYDFSANVKTTQGRNAKQTVTVNLGVDASGTYWWDGLGWSSERAAKADVSKYSNDAKAAFAAQVADTYKYQESYRGRLRWCYTFRYQDEGCFRVAGSRRLTGDVTIEDCCDAMLWEFTDDTYLTADWLDKQEITPVLLHRFGGLSLDRATKVEFAGTLGDGLTAMTFPSDYGVWSLAGQGAWDSRLDLIKNISGNIVGILPPSDCEYCCDYDTTASFFICGDTDNDGDDEVEQLDFLEGTAAFGTWSLKYNARKSR